MLIGKGPIWVEGERSGMGGPIDKIVDQLIPINLYIVGGDILVEGPIFIQIERIGIGNGQVILWQNGQGDIGRYFLPLVIQFVCDGVRSICICIRCIDHLVASVHYGIPFCSLHGYGDRWGKCSVIHIIEQYIYGVGCGILVQDGKVIICTDHQGDSVRSKACCSNISGIVLYLCMDVPARSSRRERGRLGLTVAPRGPRGIARCGWCGTLYFGKALYVEATAPIFILEHEKNVIGRIQVSVGWVGRYCWSDVVVNNGQCAVKWK